MFLDKQWMAIECPKCNYSFDTQIIQIRLQENVFCPCCKSTIKLIDEGSSVAISGRKINRSIDNLFNGK